MSFKDDVPTVRVVAKAVFRWYVHTTQNPADSNGLKIYQVTGTKT